MFGWERSIRAAVAAALPGVSHQLCQVEDDRIAELVALTPAQLAHRLRQSEAVTERSRMRREHETRIKEAQARFEMEQRSELFHQIDPLSFDAFEIQPVAEQGLSLENGGLRFVALQLKCRLKGQVGGNGFYVSMLARMDVATDGGWKVKALTFPSGPPFWSRGYNHVLRAQHTIVVHKEGANDLAHARELAGELEQAWTPEQHACDGFWLARLRRV